MHHFKGLILAGSALCLSATPAMARAEGAAPVRAAALPPGGDMRVFARQISIAHDGFTLPNGLRVLVHTDRSAPRVAVSVWYDVGSKHEPKGHTGFAHLFEHLMFNGSENVPGDFFKPLQEAGATDMNGTTANDRTNYYETVPTRALERALFMESDRMGHLLGAVSQAVLDEQRGVVENEKREGDDNPYAVVDDRVMAALYPADHPYGHAVIGSMTDLEAAKLDDVRGWFRDHYGPNNAVLVLAGDIDVATAKPLVEKYFGDIARGPANVAPVAPVPTLAHRIDQTVTAPINSPSIVRAWAVPGYADPDSLGLDVVGGVLTRIDSALLDRVLVRDRKLFESISASNKTLAQGATFTIRGRVAAGVDPKVAGQALDETIARFLATGPTQAEIDRWSTNFTVNYAMSLEALTARAEALAQGLIFTGDADAYHRDLDYFTSRTPATVLAVARRWLGRPAYALTVLPGARVKEAAAPPTVAAAPAPVASTAPVRQVRMPMPGVDAPAAPRFPAIERTRLSNGIEVIYAHMPHMPFTQLPLNFPAGMMVDSADRHGLQALMMSTMVKGVPGYDAAAIEAYGERLGISLSGGAGVDNSAVSLSTPSINLAPALTLLARTVMQPSFPTDGVEKSRRQTMDILNQRQLSPDSLILYTLPPLIDAHSPYALHSAFGEPQVVSNLTRADLIAAQRRWIRPEGAKLFVISDQPLSVLRALLERELGQWHVAGKPEPIPTRAAPDPAPAQIVLIDRPDTAQVTISGGQRITVPHVADLLPLDVANGALGGNFLSRLNMNLREGKHWSYGVSGAITAQPMETTYIVDTSVQPDKAGPAIAEIRREVHDFLTDRPMTQAEFDLVSNGALRSMADWFTTSAAVLGAMQQNDLLGRPDNYYNTLPASFAAMTPASLNALIRRTIDPATWVWAVVGDAATLRPQLEPLGLPVHVIKAADVAPRG